VKLLPARIDEDGTVRCGELTCPCILGRVLGNHLVVAQSLSIRRGAQGKPSTPLCYAQPYDVRRRGGAAAHTGKRISARARVRAATPAWLGERVVNLGAHAEVWIRCPRHRDDGPVTVVQSAEILKKHGATP
jgi:hypothetical protein